MGRGLAFNPAGASLLSASGRTRDSAKLMY